MIGWILLALYVIGWAGFSVTITRFVYADLVGDGDGDIPDRVGAATVGMLLAVFWPLVIPGRWVYKRAFGSRKEEGE